MPELIDRQALKNHLYRAQAEAFKRSEWYVAGSIQSFIDILDKQPTIEAEPVRQGLWIPYYSDESYNVTNVFICSECEKSARFIMAYHECEYGFCPHCGARMDGGADNGKC